MVITVMGIIQTNGFPGFIVTPGDMTIAALSFNSAAVLITFIGCLGAWKEYRCLLYTVCFEYWSQFTNCSKFLVLSYLWVVISHPSCPVGRIFHVLKPNHSHGYNQTESKFWKSFRVQERLEHNSVQFAMLWIWKFYWLAQEWSRWFNESNERGTIKLLLQSGFDNGRMYNRFCVHGRLWSCCRDNIQGINKGIRRIYFIFIPHLVHGWIICPFRG